MLKIIIILAIAIPTLAALIYGSPFIPTPWHAAEKMLKVAKLKKGQKVYDIGCGDGRIMYLAARDYDVEAIGIELSPLVYFWAKIRNFFWKSKAKIIFRDARLYDLSDADVIFCYLLPNTLGFYKNKFKSELKKGTKIVSYAFEIPGWKPTQSTKRDRSKKLSPIWIYEI